MPIVKLLCLKKLTGIAPSRRGVRGELVKKRLKGSGKVVVGKRIRGLLTVK